MAINPDVELLVTLIGMAFAYSRSFGPHEMMRVSFDRNNIYFDDSQRTWDATF